MSKLVRASRGALACIIPSVAAAAAWSGNAAAQEPTEQRRGAAALEEITVTGTRIRRDDFNAPTPTTVVDSRYMESLGLTSISDVVTQVPSNVSNFQPANTGGSAFFVGSTLANLRGLNPFFGTRTLTLVDSRRHVPTNQGGSVDLNAVPSILIDRMEVVTGGASAAYGSEAISGVVNILLDKTLEGVKLDLDYGSSKGDGDNYHVGIAGGTQLLGGRGHIVVGAEHERQDPILSCYHARDWCAKSIGLFSNGGTPFDPPGTPYTPNIPGQPQNIVMPDRRQNQVSYTGVIYNTGLQATADGTDVQPFQIGQYGMLSPTQSEVGGDGRSIYEGLTLVPETERSTAMVSMTYDFSDRLRGFFDLSYGNVLGVNVQEAAGGFGSDSVNVCIRPDNAFLVGNPNLEAAVLGAIGNGGFFACFDPFNPQTTVRKDFTDEIDQIVNTDTESTRLVLGLNGTIGESTWTWDAYYQYGKTDREQIGYDYRTNLRFNMAVDAIIDPRPDSPTFGEPVCRATVFGPPSPYTPPSLIEGCVPLNPFGRGSMSAEARAYAFAPIVEFNRIKQEVLAGSITGELWKGWGAGPLAGAAGLEFRKERLMNTVADEDDPARRVDILLQYGDEFGGEVEVSEAFIELEMPLLAEKRGAELLSVNAAYRDARYKNTDLVRSGGTATRDISMWKVSWVWDPTSFLRFRGSQSEDIRAPGFRELYWSLTQPAGTDVFGQVQNPWIPGGFPFNQDPRTFNLTGNVNLKPEEADTTTIGFVVTPGGDRGRLRFSADYYKIKLKDGIQGGIEGRIISSCYNTGNPEDCALIQGQNPTTGPGGQGWLDIEYVTVPYFNGRSYEAKGIDMSFDYAIPLTNGNIQLRLMSTHAIDTIVTSPPVFVGGQDTVRDIAGQTGGDTGFLSDFAGSPDWVHNLVFTYYRGPFMITAQGRYHTDGIIDKQTPKTGPDQPGYDPNVTGSVSVNRTPSHFTLNLTGSYAFDLDNIETMEVFANIDNALDKDPPFASGAVGGAHAVFFPTLGRTYRLGVRLRF